MSKISFALKLLIEELIKEGIVRAEDILAALGEEMEFYHVKFVRRYNYEEIAEELRKKGRVFLPLSRRGAYYAHNRLRKILGVEVRRERVVVETEEGIEEGYLFYLPQKE